MPGGHFDENETPVEGLKRELKEELNVNIEVDPTPLMNMQSDYHGEGHFGFFNAMLVSGVMKIDRTEIEAVGWFSRDDMKHMNIMKATKRFFETYPTKN